MAYDKSIERELKWYQRVALELLWATCRVMNYSPRWFRFYMLAPFVCMVLRIVGYRRKVILRNLELSFPERSVKEHRRIMRAYYRTLAEVIVCTICLAGATPKRDGDVIEWVNGDEHLARTIGRDWVAMASHYGCWEYFPLWCWYNHNDTFLAVYHPLKSPVFECFYRRLRNFAPSVVQSPMKETLRLYLRNKAEGKGVVLGLVSDQSPVLRPDTEWVRFLNQDTAFVEGGAKLALRFHIPAYFIYITRRAHGRYAVRFDEMYDGVSDITEEEFTRRYARALEAMIRETPELWMWSHKRWKHSPEKQAAMFGIERKSVHEL